MIRGTVETDPSPPTRIFLVRHGAAEGADGIAVGQIDLPLAAAGAASIRRLAATWDRPAPDLLLASDLARAAASAAIFAERWDLPVETDRRLREMDFGDWDGRPWRELRQEECFRGWMESWWERPPPGGESIGDVARRAESWLSEILEPAGRTVVAVAHGGTIRTALCHVLGLPLERVFHLRLDHGLVSGLATTWRGVEVQFLNADRFPAEL
jgi:broad specificity phosphatase PhoE